MRHLAFFILALLIFPAISMAPAEAQMGFGFGLGSGGWGSGIGGFLGRIGNQGFMGVGATISPRPYYSQPRLTPAQQEIPKTGQVSGMIEGCPATRRQKPCPMPIELLRQMVISAIPESGHQQWVSTQPNAQGFYQLQLPPGQYTLSVSTPMNSGISAHQERVIIHQGDRVEKNLQVDASR